ncbi:hypothetical protein HY251_03935, partial [bacterium]|nr:hypothetical protein [bacterium]
ARAGLGRANAPAFPVLRASEADLEAARRLLSERGVRGRFLIVHPGAGGKRKRWPAARFAEAAREARDALLSRESAPTEVLVLLGPAELDGPRDPALALPGVARAVFEMPALGELLGLLSLARAFLGNDAGVAHVAAALGTPTVALFGPTDPALWAPRGRGSVSCPRAPTRDMDSLDPGAVVSALADAARLSNGISP